jgi:hypothetical protein
MTVTSSNGYPRLVLYKEAEPQQHEHDLDPARLSDAKVQHALSRAQEDDELEFLLQCLACAEWADPLRRLRLWAVDRFIDAAEPLILFLGMFVVLWEIFDQTLHDWRLENRKARP